MPPHSVQTFGGAAVHRKAALPAPRGRRRPILLTHGPERPRRMRSDRRRCPPGSGRTAAPFTPGARGNHETGRISRAFRWKDHPTNVDAVARVERLAGQIAALLPNWSLAPVVEAVQAMRGVAVMVAVAVVAEVGDFHRFETPAS